MKLQRQFVKEAYYLLRKGREFGVMTVDALEPFGAPSRDLSEAELAIRVVRYIEALQSAALDLALLPNDDGAQRLLGQIGALGKAYTNGFVPKIR